MTTKYTIRLFARDKAQMRKTLALAIGRECVSSIMIIMALNRVGNTATFLRTSQHWSCFGILRTRVSSQSRLFHDSFLITDREAAFLAYRSVCGYLGQVLLCNSNESINSAVFAGFLSKCVHFRRFLFSSLETIQEKR